MNDYITTKDLAKEIKKLGFRVNLDDNYIEVFDKKTDCGVATVNRSRMREVDNIYYGWRVIDNETQGELYDLLDRYARTPIEKREEEKKYRLRLDVNNKIENNWQILGKNRNDGAYHIGLGHGSDKWQTTFTQAEIDEMGDLIKGFVKEEVCEN